MSDWSDLERVAAEIGVKMEDVVDAATGLPLRKPERVPTCPGCGAKFQHDQAHACCKACGLPDEVLARGVRAVRRWQKAQGQPQRPGGTVQRRRRRHGRPRGAAAPATGPQPRYRRKRKEETS